MAVFILHLLSNKKKQTKRPIPSAFFLFAEWNQMLVCLRFLLFNLFNLGYRTLP